jgi:hypothetical protein
MDRKNIRRLFKRHAMLDEITPGVLSIPDERDPVQFEAFVHGQRIDKAYLHCQYADHGHDSDAWPHRSAKLDIPLSTISWRCVHGKDFRLGQVFGLVGEAIVIRLIVDEDLMIENEITWGDVEQTGGHDVLTGFLKAVKEVGAALTAESAFGPCGRFVDRNVFFTRERDVAAAIDGQ